MKPISSWWGIAFNGLLAGVAAVWPSASAALIAKYPWSAPLILGVAAALQGITNQGPATKPQ